MEKLLFEEQFTDSVQALAMDWGQEMDNHTPLGMENIEIILKHVKLIAVF